ncbi:MAG TPA: CpaD family pilus assembly protein [Rhizomicrobium sp.]|nr:CpaD family pilus assembly protein [Rhizomicrobium sp.]
MAQSDAMRDAMRAAAIAAVLLAGSCAAPTTNAGREITSDPDANHPIVVDTAQKSIRVSFTAADAGLMPDDAARFDAFVNHYLSDGDGMINVTAPAGPTAQQTLSYFGERLAAAGVPRSRIMVGTRNDGDPRVELNYIGYVAHTDKCGDWSSDAADTFDNQPMADFGCAVQHNIAAEIENPRDIVEPGPLGPADATRRSVVMGHYQKGEPSAATKHTTDSGSEQSAPGSGVGN